MKCAENDVFLSVCDLLKCVLLSITRTLRVAMKERLHDVHWSNYKQKSSWIYNAMVCTLSIMQWEYVLRVYKIKELLTWKVTKVSFILQCSKMQLIILWFLSSPIECVAFERLELLRTEITIRRFFFVVHLSFFRTL